MGAFEEGTVGKVNWNRVIIGGVAAGVVMLLTEMVSFGGIFNEQIKAAMAALGKDFEAGGMSQFAYFLAYALVMGITMVWLYAQLRSTYGPGPQTALKAGLVVWALVFLAGGLGYAANDLWPWSLILIGLAVGLVETALGALVGVGVSGVMVGATGAG
ncbi:MAG: hypothetical protein IPL60_17695 [Ardenticatenia bacterium]|nr:hypothetical protein [Ardenticatenia bacterium]